MAKMEPKTVTHRIVLEMAAAEGGPDLWRDVAVHARAVSEAWVELASAVEDFAAVLDELPVAKSGAASGATHDR